MTSNNTFFKMEQQKESIHTKRKRLRELSAVAKEMIESGTTNEVKVNDVLINDFYKNEQHQTFNTFWGWKKEGYSVKKGEKAFLIWGRPSQENKEGDVEPVIDRDEDDNGTFFPLAYLFSNAQVEPIKPKGNA